MFDPLAILTQLLRCLKMLSDIINPLTLDFYITMKFTSLIIVFFAINSLIAQQLVLSDSFSYALGVGYAKFQKNLNIDTSAFNTGVRNILGGKDGFSNYAKMFLTNKPFSEFQKADILRTLKAQNIIITDTFSYSHGVIQGNYFVYGGYMIVDMKVFWEAAYAFWDGKPQFDYNTALRINNKRDKDIALARDLERYKAIKPHKISLCEGGNSYYLTRILGKWSIDKNDKIIVNIKNVDYEVFLELYEKTDSGYIKNATFKLDFERISYDNRHVFWAEVKIDSSYYVINYSIQGDRISAIFLNPNFSLGQTTDSFRKDMESRGTLFSNYPEFMLTQSYAKIDKYQDQLDNAAGAWLQYFIFSQLLDGELPEKGPHGRKLVPCDYCNSVPSDVVCPRCWGKGYVESKE